MMKVKCCRAASKLTPTTALPAATNPWHTCMTTCAPLVKNRSCKMRCRTPAASSGARRPCIGHLMPRALSGAERSVVGLPS
eukprot:2842864-Alexandrium_andersonii.AAC.1